MPTVLYATRADYPVNSKDNPITLEEFRAYVEADPSLVWWDEVGVLPDDFPKEKRKLIAVYEADSPNGYSLEICANAPLNGCLTFVLERRTANAKIKLLEVARFFGAHIFRDSSARESNKPLLTVEDLKNEPYRS